ncbi:hypothetical protein D9603_19235 [Pseudoalteromonas sp. PS5]|nr:hypothetical protein D9603_19235 [Pseudoalteromonas sp. PS5]
MEVALSISGLFCALFMPPAMYFLFIEYGAAMAYVGLVFASFGFMMVLTVSSMLYLKWRVLSRDEYKRVLGNRASINFFMSFSSDIYTALEFVIDSLSSKPDNLHYKRCIKLHKIQSRLHYLLLAHVVVIVPASVIYCVINL